MHDRLEWRKITLQHLLLALREAGGALHSHLLLAEPVVARAPRTIPGHYHYCPILNPVRLSLGLLHLPLMVAYGQLTHSLEQIPLLLQEGTIVTCEGQVCLLELVSRLSKHPPQYGPIGLPTSTQAMTPLRVSPLGYQGPYNQAVCHVSALTATPKAVVSLTGAGGQLESRSLPAPNLRVLSVELQRIHPLHGLGPEVPAQGPGEEEKPMCL